MMLINENVSNMINSPVRKITAKVELYNGSTLANIFSYDDRLVKFSVERIGENSKFFGFGVVQHAKVEILDTNREIDISTSHFFRISYGVNGEYTTPHPTFYITQARRDENTNVLTFYGYDLLYGASTRFLNELGMNDGYSILELSEACGSALGAQGLLIQRAEASVAAFDTIFPEGANFVGDENLREVLDDVAEATQTIYYTDADNNIVFKGMGQDEIIDLAITKDKYFTMDSSGGKRLKTVASITELGDNVSASIEATGSAQYVRDNAFWELREDIDEVVETALAAVGGVSIHQFSCSWRGNFLLEIGDKIELTTKDNNTVISYVLDDVITYDGTLSQQTQWSYAEQEEVPTNPSSLGDVLKQTYAKVDKANQEIDIVAGEVSGIKITTDSVITSVKKTEESVSTLMTEVSTKVSAEDVNFIISNTAMSGAEKVITTTGYTFNEQGLNISKSDSEISTTISEDGMEVYKNNKEVLVANNQGVKAEDLHATTYLIIGRNSRFEDYERNRTGCFWIGGV